MTEDQKLKILVVMNARYYGQTLLDEVVLMHVADLKGLPYDLVEKAYASYRRNPQNRFMPLPAQIREMIVPSEDPEAVVMDVVKRIERAIETHGWNWETGYSTTQGLWWQGAGGKAYSSFREAAISELGELGWEVVCRRGWVNLEREFYATAPGTFTAQLRDFVRSIASRARSGHLHEAPAMPKPVVPQLQATQGDFVKLLRGGEK